MSQSDSTLNGFFISVMDPPRMDDTLQDFAGLAHRAFALSERNSASTSETLSNDAPSHIMLHHFAVVLYPTSGDTIFSPVKVILHRSWPSQLAPVVIDFRARTAVSQDWQGANLLIEPKQIARAEEGIKLHMQSVWERNGQISLEDQLGSFIDWTVSS